MGSLSPERIGALSCAEHNEIVCPFKSTPVGRSRPACSKKGGVCSLRQYEQTHGEKVTTLGLPVTTCPHRFLEASLIFGWVGGFLLNTKNPAIISELPFLMGESATPEKDSDAVGMIDRVLVNPVGGALKWCALEMQAIYFSGKSMENDFALMRAWQGPGLPFPPVQRRPDFRSSGPKRLMPQLQINVPTISRWGHKTAVVVDRAFWESLGEMRKVRDLSNSEIAWFVVSYSGPKEGRFQLQRHEVHFTTLTQAVEGLTGGTPMSLEKFETAIRERLPLS